MGETVKMTREQLRYAILKLLGWHEIEGPKTDYDGPCEWGMVLAPPGGLAGYQWPPRGKIPYEFFLSDREDFTKHIERAWKFVEMMPMSAIEWGADGLIRVRLELPTATPRFPIFSPAGTVPLAICLAYYEWKTGQRIVLEGA